MIHSLVSLMIFSDLKLGFLIFLMHFIYLYLLFSLFCLRKKKLVSPCLQEGKLWAATVLLFAYSSKAFKQVDLYWKQVKFAHLPGRFIPPLF